MDFRRTRSQLEKAGVRFQAGLLGEEVRRLEALFKFTFPPDYRAFLMAALPVGKGFVNWRTATEAQILGKLNEPLDGIRFDIEHNDFWRDEWGTRPADPQDALAIARKAVACAPVLIPVYSHRYIPATPSEEGNPIFSVVQTDIIVYGRDLDEYFCNELGTADAGIRFQITEPVKPIPFWSDLAG